MAAAVVLVLGTLAAVLTGTWPATPAAGPAPASAPTASRPAEVAPPPTAAAPTEPPRPERPTRRVTDFGARPDDGIDDTKAIQRALQAVRPGERLLFPPGDYQHSAVLTAAVHDVEVSGGSATLTATAEQRSAFRVAADDVVVDGLTFAITRTTQRFTAPEQQKIWLSGHRGVQLRDVTVTGSAAAGIFVDGQASDFRIERVRISDTRADGVHITGGAHDGQVVSPTTSRTGDDGVAIVSYENDRDICSDITVTAPRVLGTTWGRGVSVVGGRNITYTDLHVEDSSAAAVYVAIEGDPYYTRPVENVRIIGGQLLRSNTNPAIDHGAVVIFSGRTDSAISRVQVENVAVDDTRATASQDIAVIADGVPPADLSFTGVRVNRGAPHVYGGNVPPSSYRVQL